MSLTGIIGKAKGKSAPRASGDEPRASTFCVFRTKCSPRERG